MLDRIGEIITELEKIYSKTNDDADEVNSCLITAIESLKSIPYQDKHGNSY
jgi:hypothetical protein